VAGNTISITFAGDASKLEKALDGVGDKSVEMAGKVQVSTNRFNDMGRSVGDSESAFIGMADVLDGLGASFGLPTEGAVKFIRGIGDITGGISTLMPIISGLPGMLTKVSGAMTFLAANPLIAAIAIGGAIIVGLVLLEKKFGFVSKAVGWLGDAFKGLWPAVKSGLNFVIAGVNKFLDILTAPARGLAKLASFVPGAGGLASAFSSVLNTRIPQLAVGGDILQTGLAVVHKGERVVPAKTVASQGSGTSVTVNVAGSVVTARELVRMVRDGLAREGRVGGAVA